MNVGIHTLPKFITILCVWLICQTATAQDTTSGGGTSEDSVSVGATYTAPEGTNVTYDGKDGVFFTLDEYKTWGHIYLDYVNLFKTNVLLTGKLVLQDQLILNLNLQLKNLESLNTLYLKDRNFYKDAYTGSLKERSDQQLKADVEKYILYALLAAESIAMAAMGINAAVKTTP